MKHLFLRIITISIALMGFGVPIPRLGAQTLPDWVNNPPKNTKDFSYFVGKGAGETLEDAKKAALKDLEGQFFYISDRATLITRIPLGISANWVETDDQFPWLHGNGKSLGEFSTGNETSEILFYALYEVSKAGISAKKSEIHQEINGFISEIYPALIPGTIEQAVYAAAIQLAKETPRNLKLAVINVASGDTSLGEFALEELTGYLSASGSFQLFDRKSLDSIRKEQRFQMTGEVDDASALSIGKFTGADVVITGSITGSGSTRRLRFKALEVKTAAILSQTSQGF